MREPGKGPGGHRAVGAGERRGEWQLGDVRGSDSESFREQAGALPSKA
jgi:hypothetical protein